jgi:hypothetical protein
MGKKKPNGDKGKDGQDQGREQSRLGQQRYSSRRGRKASKKK